MESTGDTITPPNCYLRFRKILYGLKRSPCHWYNLANKILTGIGLYQCSHSPCVFHGCIIPNAPPIYVGLYGDNLIYFSASDEVEKAFEKAFSAELPIEFNSPIDHFLGLKVIH